MIPNFTNGGLLPPGIHLATIDEVKLRFAYNNARIKIFEGILSLINDLKYVGCTTIFLDGSFVTSKLIPKDADICWENNGVDLNAVQTLLPALLNPGLQAILNSKYRSDVFPARIMELSSKKFFIDFFQNCKNTGLPKGIIKIEI